MAEREGFEPSVSFPTPHFQCGAFDHSTISPNVYSSWSMLVNILRFKHLSSSEAGVQHKFSHFSRNDDFPQFPCGFFFRKKHRAFLVFSFSSPYLVTEIGNRRNPVMSLEPSDLTADAPERRFPPLPFLPDTLEPLTRQGRTILRHSLLSGGRTNTCYKIEFDDGAAVVLRRYARGCPECAGPRGFQSDESARRKRRRNGVCLSQHICFQCRTFEKNTFLFQPRSDG